MKQIICALFACVCALAHANTYSTVDIYFDGDSTTYGWHMAGGTPSCNDAAATTGCTPSNYGHNVAGGTAVQETYNEPAEVLIQMNAAFGVGAVTVENHGVGGSTVLDSINGSSDPVSGAAEYNCSTTTNESHTCGPLGTRLHASHALIAVGHFGINDQYRMTAAQFQQYVSTWISTVQGTINADGQPIIAVWEEMSPICRNDAPNVGPYLTAAQTAASTANVLFNPEHNYIYANLAWLPMLSDCVHPDGALYVTMGDRLATSMSRTVQVLLGR